MRAPRRSFAAPLVITLAALPAACGRTVDHREPIHPNPPGPTDVGSGSDNTAANAPATGESWRVIVRSDGTCDAAEDMDCPEGASCNPPEPLKIACPDGATQRSNFTIRAEEGGTCALVAPMPECSAGMRCNPPPPRKIDCPHY